jgi:hypothetical protein
LHRQTAPFSFEDSRQNGKGELTVSNGADSLAVAKLIDIVTDQKVLSFCTGAHQESRMTGIPMALTNCSSLSATNSLPARIRLSHPKASRGLTS